MYLLLAERKWQNYITNFAGSTKNVSTDTKTLVDIICIGSTSSNNYTTNTLTYRLKSACEISKQTKVDHLHFLDWHFL